MTKTEYFDDYAVGAQRNTSGRTITETDVVFHAGHTGLNRRRTPDRIGFTTDKSVFLLMARTCA